MAAIGYVTKDTNGSYKGRLKTISIDAAIEIVVNRGKADEPHPDYLVRSGDVEIGAGWNRIARTTGNEYVSLSLEAPEFGPRRLYANLGRAAGNDDNRFAVLWNPAD